MSDQRTETVRQNMHELKLWPDQFDALSTGRKSHEVRRFDRDYRVGDRLMLREWNPLSGVYSGRSLEVEVTWITRPGEFRLAEDVAVLSVRKMPQQRTGGPAESAGAVRVCPLKDRECSDKPSAWCVPCPLRKARDRSETVTVPKVPPVGLLMSMAIRYDHALGVPGYYDAPLFRREGFKLSHADRVSAALVKMRQLYEEVSGAGFYRPDREEYYASLIGEEPDEWTEFRT